LPLRRTKRRPVDEIIVVVTDGGFARLYRVESLDDARPAARLVERALVQHPDVGARSSTGQPHSETNTNREAGPVHPMGAQRERHRVEHERRFARDIARTAAAVTKDWARGTVVLVAEPGMLGLLREPLRAALGRAVLLKELAKDYGGLSSSELLDRLSKNGIITFAAAR